MPKKLELEIWKTEKKDFATVFCESLRGLLENLQKSHGTKKSMAEKIGSLATLSQIIPDSSSVIMDKITTDDFILLAQISNICELATKTLFLPEEVDLLIGVISILLKDSPFSDEEQTVVVKLAVSSIELLKKDLQSRARS